MKKIIFTAASALFLFISSCSTVPLTGRSKLNLVNDSQIIPMAFQAYDQFLTENKNAVLSPNNKEAAHIKMVGNQVITAVKQYMNQNNYGDIIKNFQWEVNVVNSKEVNAWCMPGGKIVVYTGILPVTLNDAGLATVLGHEIGHAIAGHSAERMSQQLGTQILGAGVNVALSNDPKTAGVFNAIYGIGGQVAMLSWSRGQELEADRLGLTFMAMAGYNPELAVSFWQRMAEKSQGQQKPPEFLSTHPSDATRVQQIRKYVPEAMRYYNRK